MKNITLLGIGAMGSRVGMNLLAHGYSLSIYNRDMSACEILEEKGATAFKTPRQAVENADVVLAMVTDDTASNYVWLDKSKGAINAMKEGAIAIEFSTLSVDWCSRLNQELVQKGIRFLDAPVMGSRPQAELGQLIHLVGGEKSVLELVKDVLSVNSSAIHFIGSVTNGTKMKLAVNGLFGIQVAALSEIIVMLENSGINREEAIGILNELPTTSPALKGIGMLMVSHNYKPLFPISLVAKDFSYLNKLANTPLIVSSNDAYCQAVEEGLENENINAIVKLYANGSGRGSPK